MTRKPLNYLSICSGIEAATVAWHPLGWHPVGFSEIDPFARAVLAHHYPATPLHGDFTTLTENDYGAIDLLVGGTPCQSFSVAGLRKGLDDDRGNLTLEFIRLAQRSRPRWLVWENVPGVLSIDRGRTFGSFLGGLAECGYGFAYRILDAQYFGVPQRRRRVFVVGYLGDWRPAAAVLFERESVRGDITPSREARKGTAGAFETSPSGGRFTEISATLDAHCKDGPMRNQAGMGVCHTLRGDGFDASEDGTGRGTPLVTYDRQSSGEYKDNPVASTVAARDYKSPSDLVAYNVTFCDANGKRADRPNGGLYVNEADTTKTLTSGGELSTYIAFSAKDYGGDAAENAPTLRTMNHNSSHANGGGQIAVAIPLQEIGKRTGVSTDDASIGVGIGDDGDAMYTLQSVAQHGVAYDTRSGMAPHGNMNGDTVCPTLRAKEHEPPMVMHVAAFEPGSIARNAGPAGLSDTCSTLRAEMGDNQPAILHPLDLRNATRDPDKLDALNRQGCGIGENGAPAPTISTAHMPGVISPMAVRRLTPRECERLQGFPDDYTLVPYRGKPAADGNRYKALGNSMAVPVMRWLGERIQKIEEMMIT